MGSMITQETVDRWWFFHVPARAAAAGFENVIADASPHAVDPAAVAAAVAAAGAAGFAVAAS